MSILIQVTEESNRQGVNNPAISKLYGVPFISLVRDNGASATVILDGKRSNEERIVSESYASISTLVNAGYIDSLISLNQVDGELVSLKTSGIVEAQEDQSGNSIIMYRDSEKQVDVQYVVTESMVAILALIPTASGTPNLQEVLDTGNTATTSTNNYGIQVTNTLNGSAIAGSFNTSGARNVSGYGVQVRSSGSIGTNVGIWGEVTIEGVNRSHCIAATFTGVEGAGKDLSLFSIGGVNPLNHDLDGSDVRGFSLETSGGFSTSAGRLTGFYMDLTAGIGNKSFMQLKDGTEAAGKVLMSDADGLTTWEDPTSGLSETLTFGGGSSGDVATLTVVNGVITGKTLVP